jgi:hypothetical protein
MTRIQTVMVMVALSAAACGGGRANVQCEQNANCDLSGGGMCLAASTGNMWCAYPDPECPSGYRYSDQDVGDGLGGVCVAGGGSGDAGVTTHRLTVMVGGSGSGNVVSAPAGLTCTGGTCTADFDDGTAVALTATATAGTFLGWSNDCTGAAGCDVVMDRDHVVTALFGSPGEALWSQQIGGTQDDVAMAIATDSAGDLIVVGNFNGSFTVGATTLTSNGGADFFVAKLAATDGSVSWIESFGGPSGDAALSVALDSANNIYVAGTFQGTIDFGGGTIQSVGNVDGFALKLDSTGHYQWARSMGGTFADGVSSIAVHGTTVAVVGDWQGSMTINGQTVMNSGTVQAYLATFGADGTDGLVKTFPGTGYSVPKMVAIDGAGNLVLCGTLSGSADFGGGLKTSSSGDAFLAKYTSSGTYLLANVLGGTSSDGCGAIAIGPGDDIFLIGTFIGSVSFGGSSPINAHSGNMVVAKYSAAGAYDWAVPFGDTTAQVSPSAGSVNSSGDIVTAGYFCGNFMFGSHSISSVGTCSSQDFDMFAVRLSGTDGSPLTAARAGGSSQDVANGVAQTSDGRHFVAGAFKGFADFGGTSRTSAGGNDAVILGLAPL